MNVAALTLLLLGCELPFTSFEANARPVRTKMCQAPLAPTNFQGTPTANSVSLQWKSSASSGISAYLVSRNGTNVSGNLAASTLSYADSGLASQTTYSYSVVAQNSCGKTSSAATLVHVENNEVPNTVYTWTDSAGLSLGGTYYYWTRNVSSAGIRSSTVGWPGSTGVTVTTLWP